MVYFDSDGSESFWEIADLDNESIRIIIPCERYYILADSRVVRTNKGLLRKISSGEIVLYNKSLEALINQLKEHKQPHKMHLLISVSYEPYT